MSVPTPPPAAPGMAKEVFTAFARSGSREELMEVMRKDAEAYFGGPVYLLSAAAQKAPSSVGVVYQGTSRWRPRGS